MNYIVIHNNSESQIHPMQPEISSVYAIVWLVYLGKIFMPLYDSTTGIGMRVYCWWRKLCLRKVICVYELVTLLISCPLLCSHATLCLKFMCPGYRAKL